MSVLSGTCVTTNVSGAEGHVCHDQCSNKGCWGSGDDQCLSCANYELDGHCVEHCDAREGLHALSLTQCVRCHTECAGSCSGPVSVLLATHGSCTFSVSELAKQPQQKLLYVKKLLLNMSAL